VQTQTATRTTGYGGGQGWVDEGLTGYVRKTAAPGYTALYRMNLGGGGGHFMTTDAAERTRLLNAGAWDEGIVGYVATAADATHVALYRLSYGSLHVYTSSLSEVANAVADGWRNEGVIGYLGTVLDDSTAALYRVYHPDDNDHYYTTDRAQRNTLVGIHETDQVSTTRSTYDLSGNKLSERIEQAGVVYEDNRMAYDAQGHLRLVKGLSGLKVNYEYDRNGNRIHVRSEYQQLSDDGSSMTSQVHDSWSAYDEQNRQVVADGVGRPYGGYALTVYLGCEWLNPTDSSPPPCPAAAAPSHTSDRSRPFPRMALRCEENGTDWQRPRETGFAASTRQATALRRRRVRS